MLLRKEQGDCGVAGYRWEHDGDVTEVDDQLAVHLLAIPGGGYSVVQPGEPEPEPDSDGSDDTADETAGAGGSAGDPEPEPEPPDPVPSAPPARQGAAATRPGRSRRTPGGKAQ